MNPVIVSVIRHSLTGIAGVLVTKGWLDSATAEQLVGLVVGAISLGWSIYDARKGK